MKGGWGRTEFGGRQCWSRSRKMVNQTQLDKTESLTRALYEKKYPNILQDLNYTIHKNLVALIN